MMYFFDRNPAYDNHILCVTDKHETLTYAQWHDAAERLRDIVLPRSLAVIFCRNSLGSVLSYLSCLQNRVVPILLDDGLDEALQQQLLQTYHPNFIFQPQEKAAATPSLYTLRDYHVYSYDTTPVTLYEDLALLLTTSGSTGSPKLVRQSYENIQSNAASIAEYLHLSSADKPISSLPMHYTFGLSVLNSHVLVGATECLTGATLFDPAFWECCKKEHITSLAGVPFTYECLQRLRFLKMDLPDLTLLLQAGGKLSPKLHEVYGQYAANTGKRFVVMYGQTEATARMAYVPPEKCLEKVGSMGIAIPGGTFHLMDENRQEITSPHVVGELRYDGPNVTLGYAHNRGDLALGDERHGQLYTGDMAYVDEDGYFYITGRKKRFLKIMGKRVNLDEIEQLIKQAFPALDVACVGEDDALHVFCTGTTADATTISDYVTDKTNLHPACVTCHAVPQIPKNSSGKTQYTQLRSMV